MKVLKTFAVAVLLTVSGQASAQSSPQQPQWEWGILADIGTYYSFGADVATNRRGSIAIAGTFQNSLTITFPTLSNGGQDGYVALFDSLGNAQWVKKIGGTNNDYGVAVAMDDSGNVYTAGCFKSNMWLDSIQLVSAGASDIFLAKYNSTGVLKWIKRYGGLGIDAINYENHRGGLTWTPQGLYLSGEFAGGTSASQPFYTVMFDTVSLTSHHGGDAFVAKFSLDGTAIWARNGGGFESDDGFDHAVDGQGNVYLCGVFGGNPWAQFDTVKITSGGNGDPFVAKWDSAGKFQWVRQLHGGLFADIAMSVTADAAGNCYITGFLSDKIFLFSYDQVGNVRWSKWIENGIGKALACDAAGNVYLTGSAANPVVFSPGDTLRGTGGFVAKYSGTGQKLWAVPVEGSGGSQGTALAVHASGSIYVAGEFAGSLQFGGSSLVSTGNNTDKGKKS